MPKAARALSIRPGCVLQFVIVYFDLFEALGVLKTTSGPMLLQITSQELADRGLVDDLPKFLFEAVQGLSDPSATLACTSHTSFGGPVLRSVSRQLACFMAARVLKGVDICRPCQKRELCRLHISRHLGIRPADTACLRVRP